MGRQVLGPDTLMLRDSWRSEWGRQVLDDWRRVLPLDHPQRYPRGAELFTQGNASREVFLLAQGIAKLVCLLPDGEEVALGLTLPGQLIGYVACKLDIVHPVSAVAITACKVHRIQASHFERLPTLEMTRLLIPALVQALHAQEVAVIELKWLDAAARFDRLVRDLASILCSMEGHHSTRVPLPLTDRELGELLGISPGHVGRLKKQAIANGLLERSGRQVFLAMGVRNGSTR